MGRPMLSARPTSRASRSRTREPSVTSADTYVRAALPVGKNTFSMHGARGRNEVRRSGPRARNIDQGFGTEGEKTRRSRAGAVLNRPVFSRHGLLNFGGIRRGI